jgi:hypothetical protein
MTNIVRDNYQGTDLDEGDEVNFTFIDFNADGKKTWIKYDGHVERSYFKKNILPTMVKAPRPQRYVKHTKEEREESGTKGHWERMQ